MIGEGEVTLVDLLDALSNNLNVTDVKGIAFRTGDKIYVSPDRELIVDLNELPFPLFEKYPVGEYTALFPPQGIKSSLCGDQFGR